MAKRRRPPPTSPRPARPSDPAKLWTERLTRATKAYDDWAREFRVETCAKYYNGHQWDGLAETERKSRYVVNMVFATVETQLPTLMFSRPKVEVEPRPARALEPGSGAPARANLIESTIQTFIDDRDVQFTFETTLALRDAYSRFGVVEVGYSGDWIDNPQADRPVLRENSEEPMRAGDGEPVGQPKQVLKPGGKESLYVKRIPPQAVRVWPGRNALLTNDFIAYYEWHYVEDVKANRDYEHTADLKATGTVASSDTERATDDPDRQKHTDQVKLWKIWDLRKKVRHVLAEGHDELLQVDKPYTYLPLAGIKFFELADAWYPIPPIYNWLIPQDEVNETREGMKVHRRRFYRRYMREPQVRVEEFEKLETGGDGVCIEVPKVVPSPIAPIPDADLSNQNTVVELAAAKDDFTIIAGVSGEARGIPEADTATQANIVNVRQQIRESRARTQVAAWLGEIARLMFLTIRERMQLPMMVHLNVDPFKPSPGEVQQAAGAWQEVQSEQLGDPDFDISIDVTSLSPVAEEASRAQWNIVLQLLTNQPLLTLLMQPNPEAPNDPSPLLRKTLTLNGIRREQEIREIWRIGQQVVQQQMVMAMAAAVAKGGHPAAGLSPPPTGVTQPTMPTGAPAGIPAAGSGMAS